MIKIILKMIVAIGILLWLYSSGNLDFSILLKSLSKPQNWIIAYSLQITVFILASFRWRIILEAKLKKRISQIEVTKISWIGGLFNTILPGAVTGDLVKIFYLRKNYPALSKSFLITSIIFDRFLGVFGLICLMGISTCLKYEYLTNLSYKVKMMVHSSLLLFACIFFLFLTLFLNEKFQNIIKVLLKKIPLIGLKVSQLMEHIWLLGGNKKRTLLLLLISMVNQFIIISSFWIIASPFMKFNHHNFIYFVDILTFLPLAFLGMAVPISPAGLGVGNALFGSLFKLFGVVNGASLFNFHYINTVLVNLLGVLPYINFKSTYEEVDLELNGNT